MSFESPDAEGRPEPFPRLYHVIHTLTAGSDEGALQGSQEESQVRKREGARRKDGSKRDRKDKGYVMFEQEDSDDELMQRSDGKSPRKLKKHPKPTFKFTKKEKAVKTKDKEKDKDEKKEKKEKDKAEKEKEKQEKAEKEKEKLEKEKQEKDKEKKEKVEKEKVEKDQKKTDEELKPKWRKKISLPPAKQSEQGVTVSVSEDGDNKQIFGVGLALAVERSPCHDGIQLPVVVRQCIDYIEEFGLSCEGIYRMSGVKSKVQALKDAYNKGVDVYLQEHEPNIVASLLKQYLRQLPEPLLTAKLMPKFEQASTIKSIKQKVEQFQVLLDELPPCNRMLLSWVIVHMTHVIARVKENKMSLQNVSIVLSPTLQISHRVLNVLFTYSKLLFKDTVIKRYVPPLKPVTSRWTLELPDSPLAIEEELKKQESLLNHLHEELMKVKDMEKEEQLWEVQRVVTQLKRRLKHARQTQESNEMSDKKQEEIAQEKLSQSHRTKGVVSFVETKADELKSQEPEALHQRVQEDVAPSASAEDKTRPVVSSKESALEVEQHQSEEKQTDNLQQTAEPSAKVVADGNEIASKVKEIRVVDEPVPTAEEDVVETGKDGRVVEGEKMVVEDEKMVVEDDKMVVEEKVDVDNVNQNIETGVCSTSKEEEDNEHGGREAEIKESAEKDTKESLEMENTKSEVEDYGHVAEDDSADLVASEASRSSMHEKGRSMETDESSDAYTEVLGEEEEEEEEDSKQKSQNDYVPLNEELPMEFLNRDKTDQNDPKRDHRGSNLSMPEDEAEDEQEAFSETTTSSEPSEVEDNEEYQQLEQEHTYLVLEEEELLAIGNELRQKIAAERNEIERLQQDIAELKQMRQDVFETSASSSSLSLSSSFSDSDEELDDDDLRDLLKQIIKDNKELELDNAGLCDKIHQERQICIAVKVQNRMIQQRHLDSSGYGFDLFADHESLL